MRWIKIPLSAGVVSLALLVLFHLFVLISPVVQPDSRERYFLTSSISDFVYPITFWLLALFFYGFRTVGAQLSLRHIKIAGTFLAITFTLPAIFLVGGTSLDLVTKLGLPESGSGSLLILIPWLIEFMLMISVFVSGASLVVLIPVSFIQLFSLARELATTDIKYGRFYKKFLTATTIALFGLIGLVVLFILLAALFLPILFAGSGGSSSPFTVFTAIKILFYVWVYGNLTLLFLILFNSSKAYEKNEKLPSLVGHKTLAVSIIVLAILATVFIEVSHIYVQTQNEKRWAQYEIENKKRHNTILTDWEILNAPYPIEAHFGTKRIPVRVVVNFPPNPSFRSQRGDVWVTEQGIVSYTEPPRENGVVATFWISGYEFGESYSKAYVWVEGNWGASASDSERSIFTVQKINGKVIVDKGRN